ncbi:MAG TPA: thioredoxin family protein [Hypericibacter adhaerens]|uniref:DUF899 domain-containing protein n=1 Tax=Hypericibacter adhaerens TaxID=2602016 RepID=UPI002D16BC29|nr:thioredoxin family protein [Hypericibacter adhaerens]HWA46212.1 thioredoxin family protein [Hypericibacter adhaerens]
MPAHKVVSEKEWIAARKLLLEKEKTLTRMSDQLSAERRALPWVKVEKSYVFEGARGKQSLAELFGGRSQLFVYHFMFGPDWGQGCPSCSFFADHIDGPNLHLKHHDVSVVVVSRAPWSKIETFKRRMGWHFKWVSSHGSDFNFDHNVSFTPEQEAKGKVTYNFEAMDYMFDELPGLSVFYKDGKGDIFRTYSAYARGGDILLGANNFLDMTPKGRNETEGMDWVRHHDRYDAPEEDGSCCAGESDPISEMRRELVKAR